MNVEHPGVLLDAEIRRLGLSAYSVATAARLRPPIIHEIAYGDSKGRRRAITPRTALVLERAIPGRSAEEWMRLQAAYDLDEARRAFSQQLAEVSQAKKKRPPKGTE